MNRGYEHNDYLLPQTGGSGMPRYSLDKITLFGLAAACGGIGAGIDTKCQCTSPDYLALQEPFIADTSAPVPQSMVRFRTPSLSSL